MTFIVDPGHRGGPLKVRGDQLVVEIPRVVAAHRPLGSLDVRLRRRLPLPPDSFEGFVLLVELA